MQMGRPTLTGLEQDVLNLKDFKQVSKLDERLLGAGPQTVLMRERLFQLLLNYMSNNNKMYCCCLAFMDTCQDGMGR